MKHTGPKAKQQCAMFLKYQYGMDAYTEALKHWLHRGLESELTQEKHIKCGQEARIALQAHWADELRSRSADQEKQNLSKRNGSFFNPPKPTTAFCAVIPNVARSFSKIQIDAQFVCLFLFWKLGTFITRRGGLGMLF